MRELSMDAAAGDADEGPEAGAHVLRPESVAVDASAVGWQLEEPPHDSLVPLLLFPRRGRHCSLSERLRVGHSTASLSRVEREAGR